MRVARLRRTDRVAPTRDWWDKASIISGFVSSVVIAIIGLLISYSIQNAQLRSAQENSQAQIAIAKLKADTDKRLQEGQLTAQLVQHLVSKEAAQREVALVALRAAVPEEVCEKVVAVLARQDVDANVRARAIEVLSDSSTPEAAKTLATITHDATRSSSERNLAASSSIEVAARQAADVAFPAGGTFLLASTGPSGLALDTSHFTETILRGVAGAADLNSDATVSASELGKYVSMLVPRAGSFAGQRPQQPSWSIRGSADPALGPLSSLRSVYRRVIAVVVGVSRPREGPALFIVREDVQKFASALRDAGAQVSVLADDGATRATVLKSLDEAAKSTTADDLFVYYFSGVANTSPDGSVHWWLAGGAADSLSVSDINAALTQIRARYKAVIVDSCYAGAIAK